MPIVYMLCTLGTLSLSVSLDAQEVSPPRNVTIALRADGRNPTLGWFGLGLDCLECDGVPARANDDRPAVVTRVWRGGPADQASLAVGDTLLAINGARMSSAQLRAALAAAPVRSTLRVLVGRAGGRTTVRLTKQDGTVERIDGRLFTVRYRSDYDGMTIDVLTKETPVVSRDSTGTMTIRVGDNVFRLRPRSTSAASVKP